MEDYPAGIRLATAAARATLPGLLNLWYSTCRVEVLNPEYERDVFEKTQVIGALLHQHFLFHGWYYRRRNYTIMVSRSKDGEIVARILERMGYRCVRGSSSRYGGEALLELMDQMKDGTKAALLVDGPRGPAGVCKPGVVTAARQTGCPIQPFAVAAERAWYARNWMRTAVAAPYSRIAAKYGDLIHVPRDASKEECERIRKGIDDSFARLEAELKAYLAK